MTNRAIHRTALYVFFVVFGGASIVAAAQGCSSERGAKNVPELTAQTAQAVSAGDGGNFTDLVPCAAWSNAVTTTNGNIILNSGVRVDSYQSTVGAYGGSNVGANAVVQASGSVTNNGATVQGAIVPDTTSTLAVVPVPADAVNLPLGSSSPGNLNINTASDNITLAPGDYVAANINVNTPGSILISPAGAVRIWVTGNLNLGGTENPNGVPNNLAFLVTSAGSVNVNSGGALFGLLYAPTSAVNVNSPIFGSVVGSAVTLNSGSAVHFDQSSECSAAAPGLPLTTGQTATATINLCQSIDLTLSVPGYTGPFNWQLTSSPAGSVSQLVVGAPGLANFLAQTPGSYVVQVTIMPTDASTATATADITVTSAGNCASGGGPIAALTTTTGPGQMTVDGGGIDADIASGPDEENPNNPASLVPTGPTRGNTAPGQSNTGAQAAGPGGSVTFFQDSSHPSGKGNPPDSSGAMGEENVVLGAVNTVLNVSTDRGKTFKQVKIPSIGWSTAATIGPDGGTTFGALCCDQVIQYVPSIHKFLWLQQFFGSTGPLSGNNKYRLAVATPDDVISSGGTRWFYWDIPDTILNNVGPMDYPDMSIGNNFAYISFDSVVKAPNSGLTVLRVPLSELGSDATTLDINYTNPAKSRQAYGGHLAQQATDTIYWAGHNNNSSMTVFSWPENSGQYTPHNVSILSWPNGNYTSLDPNSKTWLCGNPTAGNTGQPCAVLPSFPGTGILGATVVPVFQLGGPGKTELWLAWTAGTCVLNSAGTACASNSKFPNPHVEIVRIDASNFTTVAQMQVWNGSYAFGYPNLANDSFGNVGMSMYLGGGGKFFPTFVVGFWGDFNLFYSYLSSANLFRNGDYVATRHDVENTSLFGGFGYNTQDGGGGVAVVDPRFTLFGRPSEPPPQ